jgi:hypothetical protein
MFASPQDRDFPRALLAASLLVAGLGYDPIVLAQATGSLPAGERQVAAPAPVGAREEIADVVIWSVDYDRSVKRWNDADWTGHARLLGLLRDAGLHPRVEHMAQSSFPDRWDDADDGRRLPELITADRWIGLLVDLEAKGRLIRVRSERLIWMPEVASCADFKGRWLFLVARSPHEAYGRRAVGELLKPGQETRLPGAELPATAGRDEAVLVAKRAVIAYSSGDPERLRSVASASSPQLSRCTRPDEFRRSWDVEAGSVELRGNEAIAFGRVEMHFRGKTMIGADPVAVVLRREGPHWKAFSVGDDVFCLRALPELCRLSLRPLSGPQSPPAPRLSYPDDDKPIGQGGRSFAWEVPASGEPLAAQVCEVLLDDTRTSWPLSRIKVYPGEPRERAAPLPEPALTGVTAAEMRWSVWVIGADGRVSASEARRYRRR